MPTTLMHANEVFENNTADNVYLRRLIDNSKTTALQIAI